MGSKIMGAAFVIVSLIMAAWIYMDLQKEAVTHNYQQVRSLVDTVDSLAYPGGQSAARRDSLRGKPLSQQLRGINDLQQRPTDSLKKLIEEEGLLDSR